MSARSRLGSYLLVLAVAFGAGAGLGAAVGPLDRDDRPADHVDEPHDRGRESVDGR